MPQASKSQDIADGRAGFPPGPAIDSVSLRSWAAAVIHPRAAGAVGAVVGTAVAGAVGVAVRTADGAVGQGVGMATGAPVGAGLGPPVGLAIGAGVRQVGDATGAADAVGRGDAAGLAPVDPAETVSVTVAPCDRRDPGAGASATTRPAGTVFEAVWWTSSRSPIWSMANIAASCCRPTTLGTTTLPPCAAVGVGSGEGWQPGEVGRADGDGAGLSPW